MKTKRTCLVTYYWDSLSLPEQTLADFGMGHALNTPLHPVILLARFLRPRLKRGEQVGAKFVKSGPNGASNITWSKLLVPGARGRRQPFLRLIMLSGRPTRQKGGT